MGIRETLNKNPAIGMAAGGTLVLVCIIYAWITWSSATSAPASGLQFAFFSADEGRTWFEDGAYRPFPFPQDGRPAFRAVVIQCGTNAPRVAYLKRLTDAGLKSATAMLESNDSNMTTKFADLLDNASEVRKPGTTQWLATSSAEGQKLIADAIKCPDGTAAAVVPPRQ